MDIRCPKCGEPWEADILHEIKDERGCNYSEARRAFQAGGCSAIPWSGGCADSAFDPDGAEASAALFDILGDDVDGIAAMMEDFDFLREV